MNKEQIKQIIREELSAYFKSDRFILDMTLQMQDGRNIQLGKTTGTKFGTETTQKIGFFNKAPVTQRSAISAPTGGVTVDGEARGAINSIRQVFIDLGITP